MIQITAPTMAQLKQARESLQGDACGEGLDGRHLRQVVEWLYDLEMILLHAQKLELTRSAIDTRELRAVERKLYPYEPNTDL